MKITFVDPVDVRYMGGGEAWLLTVASLLCQRGHAVRVISLNSNCEVRQEVVKMPKNVEYIQYDGIRLPRGNPLPSPYNIPIFLTELNDTDVVYFYEYPPNELFLYLFFRRKIIRPVIAGFHTSLEPKQHLLHAVYYPIFIKALKFFSAYHVLTRYLRRVLHHWGFKNVYFIPNGVNTKEFGLCHSPLNKESFNVLFAGRLVSEKGIDTLMEIINYVNERLKIQEIEFTIAGSGPFEDKVRAVAQKYKNVDYLGFVNPEVISKVYMNANLFLIPSKMEGMPLSLLEAQSCGLPVVGSKIPGIFDVIINGKTGCLVNVGNVKGFAEAIKKYYELWRDSPEEYYNMNKTIRDHIVRNYDWNIVIDRLEVMFKSLIT